MPRRKVATAPYPNCAALGERLEQTSFLNHVLDQAAAVLASNPTDSRRVRYVRALPHIMTEWFAQPRYLGANDHARPLKLKGRGPTLGELIASVLPGEDPEQVAAALIKVKAVRLEANRYVPLTQDVSFSDDLDSARAHTIGILSGHISTIQHNIRTADSNHRALEREVFNLNIPTRLLPEVHRQIRKDGAALLVRLDNFLHESQVQPGSEPTVGVGVSISAYQDRWHTRADERSPREVSREVQRSGPSGSAPPPRIDKTVSDAIQRFVRISRMFGVSQDEFIDCVRQEYFKHAETPPPVRSDKTKEIQAASDVMTVWHDDPRYTDNGRPRALRKLGRAPSFKTLVREVDPSLNTHDVLQYLIRTGTVKRRGARYVAMNDTVIVHGVEGPAVERSLRGLGLMLALTERNLTVKEIGDGLFERTAENGAVPVSKLPLLKKFVEDEGMSFLRRANTLLRELQLQREEGEPTVQAGFGVYRHQTEGDSRANDTPADRPTRTQRSARRSPNSARLSRRAR